MKAQITPHEIERLKKNDSIIYNKIFDHYYERIAFFCWRFTKDRQEGLDIASEVFLKVWNKRHKFDSVEHLNNFLYIVARNLSLNYLKKKQRQEQTFQELVQIPGEQEENKLRLRAELMEILREEAAQLKGRVGEVFKLAFFDGLNNEEISKKLGMTENNVKVHKTKAIQQLRPRLLKRDLFVLAFLISLAHNFPN